MNISKLLDIQYIIWQLYLNKTVQKDFLKTKFQEKEGIMGYSRPKSLSGKKRFIPGLTQAYVSVSSS